MRYFHIEFKTTAGPSFPELQNEDFGFYCKGLQKLTEQFDRIEEDAFVSEWTVYEYSDSQFKELVSECGSNHPVNAGAIFWDIYSDELEAELTLENY